MKNLTLNQDQQHTFDSLLDFAAGQGDSSLACLQGFAGTGKTTLVGALLRELSGGFMKIAVMAPTNKAVGVLREKIGEFAGVEFGSLHSFLGLRLGETEGGTFQCKQAAAPTLHEYDLAIVDECSMVSESLFKLTLTAKRQCRVLFVGDPAQLPPVDDDGRDSPTFRLVNTRFVLNKIVRQAVDNPIISASHLVRQAIEAGQRVSFLALVNAFPPPPAAAGVTSGGMGAIVDILISENRAGRDCRAIAWKNDSVVEINNRVHNALYGLETPFSAGEMVLAQNEFKSARISLSEHPRTVFNSEEMTVVGIDEDAHPDFPDIPAWLIELERDDGSRISVFYPADQVAVKRHEDSLWAEWRILKAEGKCAEASKASASAWAVKKAFAPLRHAYASTAHKAQGSTFDTALVWWDDLDGQRDSMAFNRMLYVAMTRAAKFMALVTK